MAGKRGNYQDNTPKFYAEDVNQDTATFLGNDAQLFQDLCDGWNVVWSGFALTAGAGMIVNIATGVCYAGGIRCAPGANSVTLAVGGSQPRYDVLYVQQGTTAGTNTPSGQPNVTDSATFGVLQGAAANPPSKPVITQANQCQIGTVYVPANATTAAGCTLNSGDTAPNSQSIRGLVAATLHAASSILTGPVHGAQATLPAGTGANQLAQTGPRGGVGALEGNWWFPGSGQTPPTDGFMLPATNGSSSTDGYFWELNPATTGSNTAAKLNISGKLSAALALLKLWASTVEVTGGLQIDGPVNALGSISAVSLNATTITESGAPVPSEDAQGRVPYAVKADQLTTAGTPYYIDHGETPPQTVGNQSTQLYTVTFNRTFTATAHPTVIPAPIATGGPVGMQYGMQCLVVSYTGSAGAWTGCVIELGQTTSAAQSLAVGWIAVGN